MVHPTNVQDGSLRSFQWHCQKDLGLQGKCFSCILDIFFLVNPCFWQAAIASDKQELAAEADASFSTQVCHLLFVPYFKLCSAVVNSCSCATWMPVSKFRCILHEKKQGDQVGKEKKTGMFLQALAPAWVSLDVASKWRQMQQTVPVGTLSYPLCCIWINKSNQHGITQLHKEPSAHIKWQSCSSDLLSQASQLCSIISGFKAEMFSFNNIKHRQVPPRKCRCFEKQSWAGLSVCTLLK